MGSCAGLADDGAGVGRADGEEADEEGGVDGLESEEEGGGGGHDEAEGAGWGEVAVALVGPDVQGGDAEGETEG